MYGYENAARNSAFVGWAVPYQAAACTVPATHNGTSSGGAVLWLEPRLSRRGSGRTSFSLTNEVRSDIGKRWHIPSFAVT
jgi:hypothetical protein